MIQEQKGLLGRLEFPVAQTHYSTEFCQESYRYKLRTLNISKNTHEISKKPSISSDISYAKAAKTNLPDLPAVVKTQQSQFKKETENPKKGGNRKHKKGIIGSEEDFSVRSSSSNSSKIALAAVVSVAKLHQKKHYKGNRQPFNSFMPILNPYYAACVPPMGMEYQPMMPIGAGFMNSPFYLSGPFSDFGLYGSDPWRQPDSNTPSKRGKKNSYKMKRSGLKMDVFAQEFLPTDLKAQECGLMIIRQMKKDDEISSTSQEPLTIDVMGQGNSEGNATPVESWDDEVSSTAPVQREAPSLQVV
ncbi:hypothetical protein Ciccas_010677 [Cichlidogyrus casuarinus]|uniref:Uncharacterized protein n=1 Tax=Cichlidogyrus casuarinus TaxID=1844966 RepID=A0ABD2PUM3_9PLAT